MKEICDARCLNGRHEKLDLLWLFIEIMPATTTTLKVFSDLECGKVEFIFPLKEGPRVFLDAHMFMFIPGGQR